MAELEMDDVTKILKKAFSPLRCEAELTDYRDKFDVKIFGPEDSGAIKLEGTPIRSYLDRDQLATLIEELRGRSETKWNVKLAPWSMPR